jgi:nicotinate-nucleotide pyrophosphorylase (carboxylating)
MEKGKILLNSARPLIELALKEDIGSGDITTEAIAPENTKAAALLTAKAGGVLCGLGIAKAVFDSIKDESITWIIHKREGDTLASGNLIAELRGDFRVLLTGERTALNFLQRMSGVATSARRFVEKLEGTKAKLLDTRKTLPGFRALDKYAVKTGWGENHRAGLFDMVMIKDNHIKAAGSIKTAVDNVRNKYGDKYKVEVETANLIEVEEALTAGADIIMLDNMNIELMIEAVKIIGGRAATEASGNVDLENIREIAETGVDFISVGALTHSAKALDISMKINKI